MVHPADTIAVRFVADDFARCSIGEAFAHFAQVIIPRGALPPTEEEIAAAWASPTRTFVRPQPVAVAEWVPLPGGGKRAQMLDLARVGFGEDGLAWYATEHAQYLIPADGAGTLFLIYPK